MHGTLTDAHDFIENNITEIAKNNLVNITVPDSNYSISDTMSNL